MCGRDGVLVSMKARISKLDLNLAPSELILQLKHLIYFLCIPLLRWINSLGSSHSSHVDSPHVHDGETFS